MQYRYEIFNFGQYSADHHARLNQMVADGWEVHTAAPNFSECSMLLRHPGLGPFEEYVPGSTLGSYDTSSGEPVGSPAGRRRRQRGEPVPDGTSDADVQREQGQALPPDV